MITRGRMLTVLAVALVVAMGALGVVRYDHARDEVEAEQRTLTRALAAEVESRRELAAIRAATSKVEHASGETRAEIEAEAAQRARIKQDRAAAAKRERDLSIVLFRSTTIRNLFAAATQQVERCLDAERSATDALVRGDQTGAIDRLNEGTSACAAALATSRGARYPYDFPDPFVLRDASLYYGYSTNSSVGNIQVIRSDDLVTWTAVGNGLAALPAWAAPRSTWAPAVMHFDAAPATPTAPALPERYVLYYAARERSTNAQCVSTALGSSPAGPFVDGSAGPLVCDHADGGSIDPEPFRDADGTVHLLWKRERARRPAALVTQPLGPDGRSLVGTPTDLLVADQGWEHSVVESPSMARDGSAYWLFYSGGDWNSHSYAEGVARCDTAVGPCHKVGGPKLATDLAAVSPGGGAVFRDPSGALWMAYHAYTEPFVGWPSSRTLRLAPVTIAGGRVSIAPG